MTFTLDPRRIVTEPEFKKLQEELDRMASRSSQCKACRHHYHGQAAAGCQPCAVIVTAGAGTAACGCRGETD